MEPVSENDSIHNGSTGTALDLSDRQLTALPPLNITGSVLTIVDLSRNLLAKLPEAFVTALQNVRHLNLANNHLAALPRELCNLKSLEILDVRHNLLTTLPAGLGEMASTLQLYAVPQSAGSSGLVLTLPPPAEAQSLFCDGDFPANATSLFCEPRRPWEGHPSTDEVRWLRPFQICGNPQADTPRKAAEPNLQPQLFVDSSDSSDVIQGLLGDCWLLSAMAVVGARCTFTLRSASGRVPYVDSHGFLPACSAHSLTFALLPSASLHYPRSEAARGLAAHLLLCCSRWRTTWQSHRPALGAWAVATRGNRRSAAMREGQSSTLRALRRTE